MDLLKQLYVLLNVPANQLVYLRDGSTETITCAATLLEVADQACYLIQARYTDNGPTCPSTDPTSGAWQGSH